MLKYRWRSAEASFNAGFGYQLRFDKNGVHPERDPGISRRQEFPYNGLLIYVSPQGAEKNYPDVTLFDRNFILLWHPACFAFMMREGKYWLFTKQNANGTAEVAVDSLSYSEMKEHLFNAIAAKPENNWQWDNETLSSRQLFRLFRLMFSNVKALEYFFRQIFMVFSCTLLFAGIFRIVSRKKLPVITFGMIWKSAIYAAFPVLLVICAFPALQLPGTYWYKEMFAVGWMIYLIFVLRRLLAFPEEDNDKKDGAANE